MFDREKKWSYDCGCEWVNVTCSIKHFECSSKVENCCVRTSPFTIIVIFFPFLEDAWALFPVFEFFLLVLMHIHCAVFDSANLSLFRRPFSVVTASIKRTAESSVVGCNWWFTDSSGSLFPPRGDIHRNVLSHLPFPSVDEFPSKPAAAETKTASLHISSSKPGLPRLMMLIFAFKP